MPRETGPESPRRTPIVSLSHGADILLKNETLQVSGSFKYRGVYARLTKLPVSTECVAASTGNHGLALATVAQARGMSCRIFGPRWTPASLIHQLTDLGANVDFDAEDFESAELLAVRWCAGSDARSLVPSFDSPTAIASHFGLVDELVEQVGRTDTLLFIPCGGGGLLAAFCLRAPPEWTIVGVQRAGVDSMRQSLLRGDRVRVVPAPETLAHGINLRICGAEPFRIVSGYSVQMRQVSEQAIGNSIQELSRAGIRASGAGAASLAAALEVESPLRRICVVTG